MSGSTSTRSEPPEDRAGLALREASAARQDVRLLTPRVVGLTTAVADVRATLARIERHLDVVQRHLAETGATDEGQTARLRLLQLEQVRLEASVIALEQAAASAGKSASSSTKAATVSGVGALATSGVALLAAVPPDAWRALAKVFGW